MLLLLACVLSVILPVSASSKVVPNWEPIWDLNLSTILQPCNDSGYFEPSALAGYGIVDFDWSNAKQLWANTKPMNCEERLVDQVTMLKQANPYTKSFVYRNLVKALPWYSEVREKITDPQYAGWFLKFKPGGKYHVPQCTGSKCTQFYHDQEQTPEHPKGDGSCKDECDCGSVPCGEYLWDHRNASLRTWLINDFLGGPMGLGDPQVYGFFLDDFWKKTQQPRPSWTPPGYKSCLMWKTGGASEEDYNCVDDMGLSQSDVDAIYEGWSQTISEAHEYILAHNAFEWHLFDVQGSSDWRSTCSSFLREHCPGADKNNSFAHSALMFKWTGPYVYGKLPTPEQDAAMFQLIRGPYAWLGYEWSGCGDHYWRPPVLDGDYGMPINQCSEVGSGSNIFVREFTKATIKMDCNSYKASFNMKEE